ncbi:tryptophan 7-halogenase [Sphingomonas sp. PL-96]|uniref:tryptophan 7-halogenase n=1 Tax=Sphingomonas sp. PL-96 TaxID=2887201 RepID=UPI001E500EB1|nr:tryptophan 7-halogenase [Sphingomonas sp. PL-96]MCC2977896.1 tryptophan 7-halogenase [Sphingomonas sp. PL-96]
MTAAANRRAAPRVIAIVGAGPVALVSAIAFARALPHAAVVVIATQDDPAALADRLPVAFPPALAFLATLGLDEAALLACGASHRIGERFDWGETHFTLGVGERAPPVYGAALHQLWLAQGAAGRFDALLPGATLAAAERFVHPDDTARHPLLSQMDFALRLDPDRMRSLLSERAHAMRIGIVQSATVSAVRCDAGIDALLLEDGRRITADLFVDASGTTACLVPDAAVRIDWSAALPVDRLLLADGSGDPSPTDRYTANPTGWSATWPLAHRTIDALGYASAATSDASALRQFGRPAAAVERIALRPGRLATPMAGNLLVLGDAAAAVGPLGCLGFTLACAQLELALSLMPGRGAEPSLAAEYNRRATQRADRMRDYAASFYLAGCPQRGEFWHPLRACPVPEGLAAALTQFRQRGTLPPVEEEMMAPGQWTQALLGLGVRPARTDPIALSVPPAAAAAAIERLRGAVRTLPAALPPYPEYLNAAKRGAR